MKWAWTAECTKSLLLSGCHHWQINRDRWDYSKLIEIWCPYHMAIFWYTLKRVGFFPDLSKCFTCISRKKYFKPYFNAYGFGLTQIKEDFMCVISELSIGTLKTSYTNFASCLCIAKNMRLGGTIHAYFLSQSNWYNIKPVGKGREGKGQPDLHRLICLLLSCKCGHLLRSIAICQVLLLV